MIYLREIKLKSPPAEDSYLNEIGALRYLKEHGSLSFSQPVTFLVGENGTGKSTILEALAVALGFNAEGGSRDFNFSTFDQQPELAQLLTTVRVAYPADGFFLRAESFYNAATYLQQVDSNLKRYGGRSLHEQSHGESFLALVKNRFEGKGIYLLDEPEAALSPQRLLSLLILIDQLVKQDSQFIIATHSPILMAYPQATIYQFDEAGIEEVTLQHTASYQISKQFLDDPERMIHYLLKEEE